MRTSPLAEPAPVTYQRPECATPPPWRQLAAEVPGLPDDTLERLVRLSAPQPWATATAPVRLTEAWEKLPRLHVLCSFPVAAVRARVGVVPAFRHMATEGGAYRELPGRHWPMFDRSGELAAILHDMA
ncbi:hypothetical protein [Streptomyces rhizosphaericus]|uniref:hypothetical protein n=1 Tax=Streptomyces rhizosphaericus TaxID=114699 RepID=UPI001FC98987|nr:hypothetical protein [Streptomyces rhizosphaericus]